MRQEGARRRGCKFLRADLLRGPGGLAGLPVRGRVFGQHSGRGGTAALLSLLAGRSGQDARLRPQPREGGGCGEGRTALGSLSPFAGIALSLTPKRSEPGAGPVATDSLAGG